MIQKGVEQLWRERILGRMETWGRPRLGFRPAGVGVFWEAWGDQAGASQQVPDLEGDCPWACRAPACGAVSEGVRKLGKRAVVACDGGRGPDRGSRRGGRGFSGGSVIVYICDMTDFLNR